ncbi:MAG: major capsid protein [Pirellulales bacterium]
MPTLLDIAKANGSDAVVGLIEETSSIHPEITMGAARTIKGLNYKTLVRTGLPTVGFRNFNEGTAATKGTYENRLVETFIFNPRWECDKAVADSHEDGAPAFISMEAAGIMEAAFQHLSEQFYYGVGNDAKGFPGLIAAYDATNMVVDAGGTTSDTGSSVWAVKFGPRDVSWVYGNGGSLDLSDVSTQRILDANDNPFTAYVQEILARPGLQVGGVRSVARIKKLTADSGKGLTDARIAALLLTFPAGIVPDVLLMSRRSLEQLRASRTATNMTGAPAPIPTEAFGVRIEVTDAISNVESLTL